MGINVLSLEFQQKPSEASLCFISITGKVKPFRVGVHTDNSEVCTADAANTCEYDLSAATSTGGQVGFKLIYWQNSC